VKRVRVLVVDDSAICREQLRALLEQDGDIAVVGEAESGLQAVQQVRRLKPHVTTMDVQMPGLGGLEAIAQIMAQTPVPILVITGRPADPRENLPFEAVRRGALDLVEKPAHGDPGAGSRLRSLVRTLADVRVVKHVAGTRKRLEPSVSSARSNSSPAITPPSAPFRVIGIGASAGGPAAVVSVLSRLPPTLHGALALVQHLPSGFLESFADYLRRSTPFEVRIVRSKARIEPGVMFLPEDDHHLIATPHGMFAAGHGPPVNGYRPSVNSLFHSMAEALGPRAIGVILSGMGSDGAEGLLRLHEAGADTIAQDESTSAVFGMPKAALEAGGVKTVLKLDRIAPTLAALASPPTQAPSRKSR
jgi:two-component system, chemotaxis family, protein-glutamate methylesterase/glutaminase